MTAFEPLQAGPYPEPTDPPDGPNQLAALATWAAGRLVMRFATTTTRDAAITSPVEGMRCVTGSGATLTDWQYRDGAWRNVTIGDVTAYTPTLTTSGTQPNLGSTGAATGKYVRNGMQLAVYFDLLFGGSGITGGTQTWVIGLPAGFIADESILSTVGPVPGRVRYLDSSASVAGYFDLRVSTGGTGLVGVWSAASPTGSLQSLTGANPWAPATGDRLTGSATLILAS